MRTLLLAAALLLPFTARADVVTRLPTADKVVALTFDACETPGRPASFDKSILDVLEAEKVPFTLFVTGLFARHNADELARLALLPQVEVENHSQDHVMHMERLDPSRLRAQVEATDQLVETITGRRPVFFRFPAGNYDAAALAEVEATGHTVVHWSFASGDPAPSLTPEHLEQWVLSKTRPGSILIFHINGRAHATAAALPVVLAELKKRGYRFARLDEALR